MRTKYRLTRAEKAQRQCESWLAALIMACTFSTIICTLIFIARIHVGNYILLASQLAILTTATGWLITLIKIRVIIKETQKWQTSTLTK